ncbi:MAG TPA: outer membrane beta-barrel protein [Candidatus Acidoferrales bacterium]|nr:outer membrane beta-barrel protein [Candidatus Acidoferrales bacterium]
MELKTLTGSSFLRLNPKRWLFWSALFLELLLMSRRSQAQQVISSAPAAPETPPALEPFANTEMDVFIPAGVVPGPQPVQPFRYKFLTLRPHVDYQFLYGTGILAAPGKPEDTIIQQIAPGLRLDIGDHWVLDYTPAWTLYSNNQFNNVFGQSASLAGGTVYGSWVLGLAQTYNDTSEPQAATGTQTREQVFDTTVNGTYTMNSKMSLDLAVSQLFNSTEQFQNYSETSTTDWLNYHFWDRFNIGIGLGIGYDNPDASPDMLYEQYMGRVNWRATDKISFQIHGGVEDRQFLQGNYSSYLSPVFGAGIQYQPFEYTQISLNADRTVDVSIFQNQITQNVGFDLKLNQRLLGKLSLGIDGGYQNIKYVTVAATSSAVRTDDYSFLNTSLSMAFLTRGKVSIFYQLSNDASSASGFSYTSHQVGFEVGFAY